MPRVRDLGIYHSALPTGPLNAITDVAGVTVGHCTVIEGAAIEGGGDFTPGQGPFRTGVTVVVPHPGNLYEDKVAGAAHVINGFGKYTGLDQVRETGSLESPIALTGTLNMPRIADALITLALEVNPYIGVGFEAPGRQGGRQGYASVNPVVGECNDGFLNDMQGRRLGEPELRQAFAAAGCGPVAEGAVGAGTGTSCFEWKGGIGSASRRVPEQDGGFTLGVLVQSNFGTAGELAVSGVPVGRHIRPPNARPTNTGENSDRGSIMMVIATDAPLDGRQLERISRRAGFGLARTGSTCHSGSGDVVIAFSTGYRIPDRPSAPILKRDTLANEQAAVTVLGRAVVEAVEEAVLNSLFMAETMVGRDGNTRHGLPVEEVVELVKRGLGGERGRRESDNP